MNADLVERLARALGVWAVEWSSEMGECGAPFVLGNHDGGVAMWSGWKSGEQAAVRTGIDFGTALVLLLGHARGLRVDLGECPECRGFGGLVEVAPESPDDPGGWKPVDWSAFVAWRKAMVGTGGVWRDPIRCPTCTVDGKPTGRRTVPWAQAVLDARPREAATASDFEDIGKRCVGLKSAEAVMAEWRADNPGDPETRAALSVLADRLQADADPLGTILAAWLRGPCGACDGEGREVYTITVADIDNTSEVPTFKVRTRPDGLEEFDDDCPKCHGHGTVLGAHLDVLTAEVERTIQAADDATEITLDNAETMLQREVAHCGLSMTRGQLREIVDRLGPITDPSTAIRAISDAVTLRP